MNDFWDGFFYILISFLLTAPLLFVIACILGHLANGR